MTKLLATSAGLTGVVAALFVTSLVFNILIWTRVKKDRDNPPVLPVHASSSEIRPVSLIQTTVTEEIATEPVVTTVPTVPRTRISTKVTTQRSSASTSPRTLRTLSTTTSTVNVDLPTSNDTIACPRYGISDSSYAYKEAASFLLSGLDERVDPCDNFYAFTCNKYLQNHNAEELGVDRFGSVSELQDEVNREIVEALLKVDVEDKKWSETERITKALLHQCVVHATLPASETDNTKNVVEEIADLFGGIPFLNHTLEDKFNIFEAMGKIEQNHAMGTLMGAMVSVDYKKVKQHALYLSQPYLPMPREFYVLPQFTTKLMERKSQIENVLKKFATNILMNQKYDEIIEQAAEDIVKLERRIASASWADTEMRNYAQQHNPYVLNELKEAYPSIEWDKYLKGLLSTIDIDSKIDFSKKRLIIAQPSYFGWLNALFTGDAVSKDTIVNYMITQLLFEESDFLGGIFEKEAMKANYVRYALRRGHGVARVGRQLMRRDSSADANIECMNFIMSYMPYGPGYVYVKSVGNKRDNVYADVKEQTELIIKHFLEMMSKLSWMTSDSKAKAKEKAKEMVKNYGWPQELFGDFKTGKEIDEYHKKDYSVILELAESGMRNTTYYKMRKALIKAYANRESLRLLLEDPDRTHFLLSPALVSAWYQPERNSITFPYASLNPPFYRYEYPQAYNYAGQGGTGGHELVHGFDDQGVQFGADGSLSKCSWNECGWLDSSSKRGFNNMAQCVITQYNTQCCPEKNGTTLCANGMTTQGENVADIAGLQVAFKAYREYITKRGKEELRLPGMEKYTPNQLFWITYGFTWCRSQTEENLLKQLLTDPHAPASCRTNQVVQDIPEFGKDFGCSWGQKMYPAPEQRCSVWSEE